MINLGEYLKKEREKKGITLEDASKVTRVRKAYLQSIEDGNFEIQPPVFIRGFLKSYADLLGLNSIDIIEKYNETLNVKEGKATAEKGFELEAVSNHSKYVFPLVLSLALVILIFILTTTDKPDTTPSENHKTEEVSVSQQKPLMSSTTGITSSDATITTSQIKPFNSVSSPITSISVPIQENTVKSVQMPERSEKRHSLTAVSREITWLQVTIDDNDPVEVLLQAGESTSWLAKNKIAIIVGNAGGVDLTFNGKPVESLGPSRKVVSRTFPQ